jgi:hypothetical protein
MKALAGHRTVDGESAGRGVADPWRCDERR